MLKKKGGIETSKRNEERNVKKSSDAKFQEKVRKRLNTSSDSESKASHFLYQISVSVCL